MARHHGLINGLEGTTAARTSVRAAVASWKPLPASPGRRAHNRIEEAMTPGRPASRTGVCPGSNEFAGRIKSAHIMPGNKYLKAALGTAALSASRSKDTYLSAKYRCIAARRGPMKAIVAVEHSILTAA